MNIWDFHLTGNISQNSAKYNHSRLKQHNFISSTTDILIYLDYISSTIRLQILVKPAIAGGAKSPFFTSKKPEL